MYLCGFRQKRVNRMKHPKFINVTQKPAVHHFCSMVCKNLWIDYVRKTGKYPPSYVEIIEEFREVSVVKER